MYRARTTVFQWINHMKLVFLHFSIRIRSDTVRIWPRDREWESERLRHGLAIRYRMRDQPYNTNQNKTVCSQFIKIYVNAESEHVVILSVDWTTEYVQHTERLLLTCVSSALSLFGLCHSLLAHPSSHLSILLSFCHSCSRSDTHTHKLAFFRSLTINKCMNWLCMALVQCMVPLVSGDFFVLSSHLGDNSNKKKFSWTSRKPNFLFRHLICLNGSSTFRWYTSAKN